MMVATSKLVCFEIGALDRHDSRYSDKYMNKARLDAIYWRTRCYECGEIVFRYDPDDNSYMICKCGVRKRTPNFVIDFTPDWGNEQRRKDGFEFLFPMVNYHDG